MMPTNRLVALLTPVFSAAAAIGTAFVRKHFPGLPVPSAGELTGLEITAATAGAASALKWLHGHQKWEERLSWAEQEARAAARLADRVAPGYSQAVDLAAHGEISRLVSDAEEFANQPPAPPAPGPEQPPVPPASRPVS